MPSHFSWKNKHNLMLWCKMSDQIFSLLLQILLHLFGWNPVVSHTGVVRMMWESWISKKSSISVSPVSSLQVKPRGPNFLFQLSKHWLHKALIGATGKDKQRIFLQNWLKSLKHWIWYTSKPWEKHYIKAPVCDYSFCSWIWVMVYRISFTSSSFW